MRYNSFLIILKNNVRIYKIVYYKVHCIARDKKNVYLRLWTLYEITNYRYSQLQGCSAGIRMWLDLRNIIQSY